MDEVRLAERPTPTPGPMASRPPSSCGRRSRVLYPAQLAAGHRAYRIVFELVPAEKKEGIRD